MRKKRVNARGMVSMQEHVAVRTQFSFYNLPLTKTPRLRCLWGNLTEARWEFERSRGSPNKPIHKIIIGSLFIEILFRVSYIYLYFPRRSDPRPLQMLALLGRDSSRSNLNLQQRQPERPK